MTANTFANQILIYTILRFITVEIWKILTADVAAFTEPMRERIKIIPADEAYVLRVTQMGKDKAQENAAKTIREVREIIGFKRF
jgi:tryptophanyl-tRNA synthetase